MGVKDDSGQKWGLSARSGCLAGAWPMLCLISDRAHDVEATLATLPTQEWVWHRLLTLRMTSTSQTGWGRLCQIKTVEFRQWVFLAPAEGWKAQELVQNVWCAISSGLTPPQPPACPLPAPWQRPPQVVPLPPWPPGLSGVQRWLSLAAAATEEGQALCGRESVSGAREPRLRHAPRRTARSHRSCCA